MTLIISHFVVTLFFSSPVNCRCCPGVVKWYHVVKDQEKKSVYMMVDRILGTTIVTVVMHTMLVVTIVMTIMLVVTIVMTIMLVVTIVMTTTC